MLKTLFKPLAIIVLATVVIAACSSKDDTPSKTKTTYLTQSAWKVESGGADMNKDGNIDIPQTFAACELDNTITFKTGGTGVFDEAAQKCDVADPQVENFVWSFADGETALNVNIIAAGVQGKFVIKSLNDTNFELYKDTVILGTAARAVIKLKH